MKHKDFEDYLQQKHAEQYLGTDDNMPDDFNDWIANMDPWDVACYAKMYAKEVRRDALMDATYFGANAHEYVMKAKEIRFLKGRLKFGNSKNSAPFPSAIVIFKKPSFSN
jgi:hypothetical protein